MPLSDIDDVVPLLSLLSTMADDESSTMSDAERSVFMAGAMEKFRHATLVISENIPFGADSITSIEPAPAYSHDWVGRFSVRPGRRVENNLGSPPKVQMAAAIFADLLLGVDLHPEYRGGALDHGPFATIFLECTDDPALALLETALMQFQAQEYFPFAKCRALSIVSPSASFDDILDPKVIGESFSGAAKQMRELASQNEFSSIETVILKFHVCDTDSPELVSEWIRGIATLYGGVARVMETMS